MDVSELLRKGQNYFDSGKYEKAINFFKKAVFHGSSKAKLKLADMNLWGLGTKINLGYFHYCSKLDTVFFKYQVSVKGFDFLTEEQIDDILNVVIKECDKYFPAFYLFFFKKQDPKYALSASLIETNGQA